MQRIGKVRIPCRLVLAPMSGITDTAFRIICRRLGAGLVYTDMVSAEAVARSNKVSLQKMSVAKEEKPVAVQVFGSDAKSLAFAAQKAEDFGADIVDLNLGCPDSNVIKQGAGSALLGSLRKIKSNISAMVEQVKIPVTAKIRLGINRNNGVKIAKAVESAGASAIAVHARTVKQGYSGKADWAAVREIKSRVSIPVIANGDVFSPENAEKIIRQTGCDFVMIGRAAAKDPFIFRQTLRRLSGQSAEKISARQKLNLFFDYYRLAEKYKMLKLRQAKMHAINFTKGISNSVGLRKIINNAKTVSEINKEMQKFINGYCK